MASKVSPWLPCDLKCSRKCTGYSDTISGLCDLRCCYPCAEQYMNDFWEAKKKMKNKLSIKDHDKPVGKHFPTLDTSGFTRDNQLCLLKWRFKGMDWQGGFVPMTVRECKAVHEEGRIKGHLKYQEYKLFPVPERWLKSNNNKKETTDMTKNKKSKSKKNHDDELDQLKGSPRSKGKGKGKSSAKASAPAGKSKGKGKAPAKGKGKAKGNGKFEIKPGTNNDAVYSALKSGKTVSRATLEKAVSHPSAIYPTIKTLKANGYNIEIIGRSEKFRLHK